MTDWQTAMLTIYIIVAALSSIPWLHGDLELRKVIWWPIELVKLLWRTLWETLATGWKP